MVILIIYHNKGGESMDAPKIQVKCNVENCNYNRSRMCFANGLEVDTSMGSSNAQTSDNTFCNTFRSSVR